MIGDAFRCVRFEGFHRWFCSQCRCRFLLRYLEVMIVVFFVSLIVHSFFVVFVLVRRIPVPVLECRGSCCRSSGGYNDRTSTNTVSARISLQQFHILGKRNICEGFDAVRSQAPGLDHFQVGGSNGGGGGVAPRGSSHGGGGGRVGEVQSRLLLVAPPVQLGVDVWRDAVVAVPFVKVR